MTNNLQAEASSDGEVSASTKPNVKDKRELVISTAAGLQIRLQSTCDAMQDGLPTDPKQLAKLAATLKRVCNPKAASGRLDVNPEIYEQWKAGGEGKKTLLRTLLQCEGKRDPMLVKSNMQCLASFPSFWSSANGYSH